MAVKQKTKQKLQFDIARERETKLVSMSSPYLGDIALEEQLLTLEGSVLIQKALELLKQSRFIGREANYMAHAVRVADYLRRFGTEVTSEGLTLALLHNILEVTSFGYENLKSNFGNWVASGCEQLVVDRVSRKEDPNYNEKYYGNLYQADSLVKQIKIFDKLDNLLVLYVNPSYEVRVNYLEEIKTWMIPLVQSEIPAFEKIFKELMGYSLNYAR